MGFLAWLFRGLDDLGPSEAEMEEARERFGRDMELQAWAKAAAEEAAVRRKIAEVKASHRINFVKKG